MLIRKQGVRAVVFGSAAMASMAVAMGADAAGPAADFASAGTAIVSVDQLMPIVDYESTTETGAGGSKTTDSATSIALVTAGGGNGASAISFKVLPRIAFDYVVGPGVTLGGSAWVFTNLSANQSTTPGGGGSSTSTDEPKGTYWGVAPRVGYVFPLGDVVAVWPRVGIEYGDIEIGSVTNNGVTTSGGSVNQLALDLDGLLVVTPVRHFGFTIGPTAGVPLTGKINSTTTIGTVSNTTSTDVSMWYVALTLGVLGYF